MESKKRVYWDDEEKNKLVEKIFALIPLHPVAPIGDLFEMAQDKVIDPDRHRVMPSITQAPWIEEALLKKFHKSRHQTGSQGTKVESLEQKIAELEEQIKDVPSKDELLDEALEEMDSTELLVRFIQKQGDEQNTLLYRMERIEGFIFNNLPELLAEKGKIKPPEKKKLVFVGFAEHETKAVKLDFGKYGNLVFVSPSMPLNNYPTECGQVFISRKGVSTALRDKLISSKHSDTCTVVDGGIAKIRKAIWNFLNKGDSK